MSGRRLGARDYKSPRRAALNIDAGQLRGFALGLALGLAVAAVVYITDHRVHPAAASAAAAAEMVRPVPQQRDPDDLGLPPERAASAGQTAAKGAPATAGPAKNASVQRPAATVSRFDFYQMLPRARVLVSTHEHVSHVPPASPVEQPGNYLLQVGSYRDGAVAEHMRSRVAQLGISATVQRITVGSDVWHRVRVGPTRDLAALNRMRRQLQGAGLSSVLLRVQDDSAR